MSYDTEQVTFIVAERNKGRFTPDNKTRYDVFDDATRKRLYRIDIRNATEKAKGIAQIHCLHRKGKYTVKWKNKGLFDKSKFITVMKGHRNVAYLKNKAVLKQIFQFNGWEVTGRLLSVDYHAVDNNGNEKVAISSAYMKIDDNHYSCTQYLITAHKNAADMAIALFTVLMGSY